MKDIEKILILVVVVIVLFVLVILLDKYNKGELDIKGIGSKEVDTGVKCEIAGTILTMGANKEDLCRAQCGDVGMKFVQSKCENDYLVCLCK